MSFNFEKLIAWQKAKDLCILIYELSERLPIEERYNFTSQMRRSAQSIASNIAEGSAKTYKKEKSRFISIAYGSLIELTSQILISNEIYHFLTNAELTDYENKAIELSKILSGLDRSVKTDRLQND